MTLPTTTASAAAAAASRPISAVLVANRGEIACRVIRTARRLGIVTVAVYSEADAQALHVAMADEARLIGPPEPRLSYLDIARVIGAARDSGAEAVHPGYGFLSENADFAEACAAAGLVFIGPSPEAIRAMGSKSAAKALMQKSGVPVVPGYHGADQDERRLLAEAGLIGFPVMIKASAGGGGRGMRIVRSAEEFPAELDGARREAKGAFGDDTVLIERYLENPRHIEVQVFGDTHGNVVHLFERDCSIQRRHQKIVEEAPAPGLDPARRATLGAAAVAVARAVSYVGAGTVEFIVERDDFYFMEMNTRLQVEHPVTEAVTGTDLVEWQLRIAAGEKLPLNQGEIALSGHAIEVRLYAENPSRGFLPATGTLHTLVLPAGEGVRVETGVRQGDRVTPFYDPMIAKIITCGQDRETARARLAHALTDTAAVGLATNLQFLARVATAPDFAAGRVDTGFIERHAACLLPPPAVAPDFILAAVVLHELATESAAAVDPWNRRDGWRPNLPPAPRGFLFDDGGNARSVSTVAENGGWRLSLGGSCIRAAGEPLGDGRLALIVDGARRTVRVIEQGQAISVFADGAMWQLTRRDPLAPPHDVHEHAGRLAAPMPGRVVQLLTAPGDRVHRGQPLIVVEAMKMEHTVAAPRDGVVAAVHCRAGDLVEEGAELVALAAEA
jgi:3-methylcrotonyl-CoA carboxylase alpha subunit